MDDKKITKEDLIISSICKGHFFDIQHFHCKHCGAKLWEIHHYKDMRIRSDLGSEHYCDCPVTMRPEDPEANIGEMIWS